MQLFFILMATLVYVGGCYLTYSDQLKEKWWYMPLGLLLGLTTNFIWFYAVKWIGDKDKIYVFTLFWESFMVMVYYGLPILFFGVKIDRWTAAGLGCIILGMVLLKLKH